MKVISIWQPYATLAALGLKVNETRTWPAPPSVVGQTIGIASTKSLNSQQRAAFNDPEFQERYQRWALPSLEELPRGFLLGTVILDSVELMTEDYLDEVSAEEKLYGWYAVGNFAWRLRNPKPLSRPIPIVGRQGIFEWDGVIPDEPGKTQGEANDNARPRPEDTRRDFRVVERAPSPGELPEG